MDKTFDVEGIAKIMVIYRGGLLEAKKPFKVVMTEKELNDFRDCINITKCQEVGKVVQETSKSDPIVKPQPKTEKQEKSKGVNNGVQKPRTNSSNKNKHKNNA